MNDETDYETDDEEGKADVNDPNTCVDYIDGYDKNIKDYLAKHADNFIIEYNNTRECQSLSYLKKQVSRDDPYGIYYECSKTLIEKMTQTGITPFGFGPGDYYTDTEYVKLGSTNFFIIKPDWMFSGPVPYPRYFKIVESGIKKRLVNKAIITREDTAISGIHCDPKDEYMIYRIKPIFHGGRMKKQKNKKVRKTKKNKKARKTRKTRKNRKTKR